MKKQLYKLDNDGYLQFGEEIFVDLKLLGTIPLGYIDIPLPCDEFGSQLPFYKPKWNGEEWVEGATQEYIDDLNRFEPSQPTIEQRTSDLEDIVNMMLTGGI